MQPGTNVATPKVVDIIQGQHAHTYNTYNVGVHSCSATSSWLYDGTHTGCAFALQNYHLRRGCVETCWAVQDTHQGFSPRALLAAPKGERLTSEQRPVELPQLARWKGCCTAYYA